MPSATLELWNELHRPIEPVIIAGNIWEVLQNAFWRGMGHGSLVEMQDVFQGKKISGISIIASDIRDFSGLILKSVFYTRYTIKWITFQWIHLYNG